VIIVTVRKFYWQSTNTTCVEYLRKDYLEWKNCKAIISCGAKECDEILSGEDTNGW